MSDATYRVVDDGQAVEIDIDFSSLTTVTARIPFDDLFEMYARARSQQLGVDARGDL